MCTHNLPLYICFFSSFLFLWCKREREKTEKTAKVVNKMEKCESIETKWWKNRIVCEYWNVFMEDIGWVKSKRRCDNNMYTKYAKICTCILFHALYTVTNTCFSALYYFPSYWIPFFSFTDCIFIRIKFV